MHDRPGRDAGRDADTPGEELERLRRELAEARWTVARLQEAATATGLRHSGELAVSEARGAAAEVDARAAWTRAAELGASLTRRVAEGQARLLAAQAAVARLESANLGLAEGRAAVALREADLRAVIESAIDCAIVTTDGDGLVLAWNSGASRLLGWEADRALAMDLRAALPPADRQAGVLEADIEAVRGGGRVSREGWLRRSDGGAVWAGIEVMALRAEGQAEPVGVLWMLRDRGAARRAAAELRASEDRHRLLVESWAQATWETDATGRILADSPSWRAFTGQTPEAWLGDGCADAIHPDDRAVAAEGWRAAVAAQRPLDAEFRLRHAASGGWRWTNVRAAPLRDAEGAVLKWVGMNIDIHDRKQAEEAARRAGETFRRLVEDSPFGTYVVDADFRVAFASATARSVFGDVVPLVGRDLAEALRAIWAEPFATEAIGHFRHTLATGEPFASTETRERRADRDATEAYDWRLERITLADGRPGVVCHFYDLTQRRALEAAVVERERRLGAFVEATSNVVYRMSPDWRVMLRLDGAGFLADTQAPSDDWVERYIPEEEREHLRAAIAGAVEARRTFELEHRVRRADGTIAWALSRAVPILGADGGIVEWFGAASDITGRKRAEAHRELLVNELNHRIKKTLATVQSIAAQTLRTGCEPGVRRVLQDRLISLARAHDLLTAANWEGAGLREVACAALDPHAGAIEAGRVRIAGPDVWLSPKAALSLAVAFHELATNAVKYGALSAEAGRVALTWTAEAGRLALTWRESGGPPVTPPTRRGFGSRLLEQGLAHELGAAIRLDYAPGGLVCEIAAPLPAKGDAPPGG